MYFVYVLQSLKNRRFYVGQTNDLERRLLEHNSGVSKYTSLTRPFALVYSEKYQSRLESVAREKFLKSGKGREWLKGILVRAVALGDRSRTKVRGIPQGPQKKGTSN